MITLTKRQQSLQQGRQLGDHFDKGDNLAITLTRETRQLFDTLTRETRQSVITATRETN